MADIPDYDKTSLEEVQEALANGEASPEEQEAASQFIGAVIGLAEAAIKFTKILEANNWVAENEEEESCQQEENRSHKLMN